MHSIGTGKVLADLDHEKDDALPPLEEKGHNDDTTSMYDEFDDELEKIHDNGAEIVVVSNFNARIELEFSMYETYNVTDLEKNEIIAAVSLALPMNRDTTAKFRIFLW